MILNVFTVYMMLDGQTTLRNSWLGRTHGLRPPTEVWTAHHSLTVLLGRVVTLRSSEAGVLRLIDSLARRQNQAKT